MKILAGYTILYDAECPMCNLYTRAFVSTGMLDKHGRAAYQQMPEAVCPLIDRQRAINEIALVNSQTGEVHYGIRSLFKVIGNAMPVFGPLFNFGPFVWIMSKVYAFISYNRKLIIPVKANPDTLQPTFNLFYRLLYLLFTCFSVGFVLTRYAPLLTGLVPADSPYRELMICGGQVIFQGIIVSLYKPVKRWDYLGNMMTISLAGTLLLLPVILLANMVAINPIICLFYFMLVATLMLLEHIRRSKLMDLGWLLTITLMIFSLTVFII